MRPALSLLFLSLLGCASLSLVAQVVKLQLSDTSASGSPISASGTVIVAESIESSPRCQAVSAARCSVVSEQNDITLRNVSDKPVVAFVSDFKGRTPSGNSFGMGYEAEMIFGGPLLAPDETAPGPGSGGVEIRPETAEVKPTTPQAEFRILFVQFADGTTFGDPEAGEHLLLARQKSLEAMARLDGIFSRHGEQAFVQALQQTREGELSIFRQIEKQWGPAESVSRMRRALSTAEQRLAAMTAQAGR